MRVAGMGTGGIGGHVGAQLAAAGEDVAFVARGAHLDAMRRDGLRLRLWRCPGPSLRARRHAAGRLSCRRIAQWDPAPGVPTIVFHGDPRHPP